jgi:phosphoserine phosphatase RsbU/P
MATVETAYLQTAREQLQDRRERLENVMEEHPTVQLSQLLTQVDQALERIDTGHFGMCTVCHETVEADRLLRDPLVSVCLGCLSPAQQRALEYDLELAAQIQNGSLPAADLMIPGWQIAYHYRPAGVIGGDYFDVIADGRGGAYFLIADVAGKGVAAAMLTANLRAVFRALIPLGLDVEQLLGHANRLFCEGKLPMQYATLVFGHSSANGELQLVNAGHLPALLVQGAHVTRLESDTVPLGLFADQEFKSCHKLMRPADMLVLYTDGVTEAQDSLGTEYGVARLQSLVEEKSTWCPQEFVVSCRECLKEFRGAVARADDETLLAIQYIGAAAQLPV